MVPWLRNVLRALVLTVLVCCVAAQWFVTGLTVNQRLACAVLLAIFGLATRWI